MLSIVPGSPDLMPGWWGSRSWGGGSPALPHCRARDLGQALVLTFTHKRKQGMSPRASPSSPSCHEEARPGKSRDYFMIAIT